MAKEVYNKYKTMMKNLELDEYERINKPPITSSNVYLTTRWMLIIPRKADRVFHGVSLNSLGMLGSMAFPISKEHLVPEVQKQGYQKIL